MSKVDIAVEHGDFFSTDIHVVIKIDKDVANQIDAVGSDILADLIRIAVKEKSRR